MEHCIAGLYSKTFILALVSFAKIKTATIYITWIFIGLEILPRSSLKFNTIASYIILLQLFKS